MDAPNTIKITFSESTWPRFKAEITNCTTSALPACNAFILEGSYFKQSLVKIPIIHVGETIEAEFNAEVKAEKSYEDLEPLRFQYRGAYHSFYYSVSSCLGDLKAIKPPPGSGSDRINILLFGTPGSSKSSFVNSILTLLHPTHNRVERAPTGGASKHVTRSLQRYNIEDEFGLSINFWDSWGLTPESYKNWQLEEIMFGHLPSGWEMTDNIDDNILILTSKQAVATRSARKIHGVLFFVSIYALDDSLNIIKQNYSKLQIFGMDPLVILTKLDEICPKIREDPTNANLDEVNELKVKASQMLDIAPNKIFVGINYTNERGKVFNIDKANAIILKEIMRISMQQFIQNPAHPSPVKQEERDRKLLALIKKLPHAPLESYKIVKVLGQGCNGIVFLAEVEVRNVKDQVALKMILNFQQLSTVSLINEFLNEFKLLDEVLNDIDENIIFMICQFIAPPTDEMISFACPSVQDLLQTRNRITNQLTTRKTQFFVLEYHPEDLESHLKRIGDKLTVERVMKYSKEIVKCFKYLYNKHVVHRDVKLNNILVSGSDEIILSDFGESVIVDASFCALKSELRSGNQLFTAPEIHNQFFLKKDSEKIDFSNQYSWEVGCLLYEIAFGCFPFDGYPALFNKPPNIKVPLPSLGEHLPGLSKQFIDIIGKMLISDPNQRISFLLATELIENI